MHAFFACALTVQAVNTAFAALIKAKTPMKLSFTGVENGWQAG